MKLRGTSGYDLGNKPEVCGGAMLFGPVPTAISQIIMGGIAEIDSTLSGGIALRARCGDAAALDG